MRTIANKGICLCLSFLLASGVLLSGLACPRQAHAVLPALAIPAGAAAMGVTADNLLVAFGMVMAATTGVSLQSYIGVDKQIPEITTWTNDEKQRAIDAFNRWVDWLKKNNPSYGQNEWQMEKEKVKTEKPPKNSDGGDPSNNPEDFDGNSAWWLIACMVGGNVAADSLSGFVDSMLGFLNENPDGGGGPLWLDTTTYPDLNVSVSGNSYSVPVSSSSNVTWDVNGFQRTGSYIGLVSHSNSSGNYSVFSEYATNSAYEPYQATEYVTTKSDSNSFSFVFRPSTYLFALYDGSNLVTRGVASSPSNTLTIDFAKPGKSTDGRYQSISYDLAKMIDPTYMAETSTSFNNEYQANNTPDTITSGTSEKKAAPAVSYLNDYSTVSNSNPKEYHVTAPIGSSSSLPSDWSDIFTVTKTEPKPSTDTKPDTPTPSPGGGIDLPDDYKFPDSWSDMGFNRVFPFFFFDDLYRLADSWLSADSYNSKFSMTIQPSFWGASSGKAVTLTVDATSLERYRQFVRGIFLALTFVGLVARMYEWWSGGSTRAEKDE